VSDAPQRDLRRAERRDPASSAPPLAVVGGATPSAPTDGRTPRLWSTQTFVSLAIAAVLLIVMAAMIDLEEVWQELVACDKSWALLAMAAHYCTYPARGWRWHRVLNHIHGGASTAKFGLLVFFYNFVDNLVPAKLGDLYGAHLARINLDVSRAAALGSIVFLRMIDAWVVLILAGLASFALFADDLPIEVVSALILGVFIAVVATVALVVATVFKKRLPAWIPSSMHTRIEAFQSGMWPHGRELVGITLLTALIWGLEGLWILFLCYSFGLELGGTQIVFLTMIPLLASAFPLTPSGAGAVELTLWGCLRVVGVSSPVAASLTVLNRLIDYWLHIALGLVVWGFRHRLGLQTWREVPMQTSAAPADANG